MEDFRERVTASEPEQIGVSLNDLVDLIREVPKEYADLIRQQEQELALGAPNVVIDTEFAARWRFFLDEVDKPRRVPEPGDDDLEYRELYQEYQELDRLFHSHLSNAILIDLGGGREFMKSVAYKYGASTYINVDRTSPYVDDGAPVTPLVAAQDIVEQNLRQIRVKSDMLDFVSRLRSTAVNFVLNGIDQLVIDNHAYHQALVQELMRVAQKGSLIFGNNSVALELLAQNAVRESSSLKEHSFYQIPGIDAAEGRVLEVVK